MTAEPVRRDHEAALEEMRSAGIEILHGWLPVESSPINRGPHP
jgi:hypothetical protein